MSKLDNLTMPKHKLVITPVYLTPRGKCVVRGRTGCNIKITKNDDGDDVLDNEYYNDIIHNILYSKEKILINAKNGNSRLCSRDSIRNTTDNLLCRSCVTIERQKEEKN